MPNRRRLTEDQADALVNQYDAGVAVKDICEEFDVSATTVRNTVRRAGRELRPVGRPAARLQEES